MKKSSKYGVVSKRARKLVDEFLRVAERLSASFEEVSALTEAIGDLRNEIIPAFAEAWERENARERFVAAWMILVMAQESPGLVRRALRLEAEIIVVHTLANSNDDLTAVACYLLSGGGVPERARPELLKLLEHSSEAIQFFAAAAIATLELIAPEALGILGRVLEGDNSTWAAMAAVALLRIELRESGSAQVIVERFPRLPPEVQYHVINSIKPFGTRAVSMGPALQALLDDEETHAVVRGRAAAALGNICRDTTDALPTLLTAIHSNAWEIVYGAAEGLAFGEQVPDAAVERLSNLLSHDDVNLRRAAAHGLQLFGRRAAAAIPALLARVGTEGEVEVCQDIAFALGAIGEPAAAPLVQVIRDGDPRCLVLASAALLTMGAESVPEILQLLGDPDESVRKFALPLLRDLGRNATAAVPLLAEVLEESTDEIVISYLLAALRELRWEAASAAPSVIGCLMDAEGAIVELCQDALWNMGPDARPELEKAVRQTEGIKKFRLEEVLAGLRAMDERRFARFERLNQDKLLKMFMEVGRVLTEKGPTSWPDLAEILTAREAKGELVQTGFSTSASALRTRIKDLETELGESLTSHGSNKKGELTTAGESLLPLVIEYLAVKRRRASGDGEIA